MQNFTLTVEIPDELAARAQAVGIDLNSQTEQIINTLIRQIERREAAERLIELAEQLHTLPDKPTPEEIAEEIRAYWEEQKTQREGSSE